jgi:hypothetical protein
VSFFDHALVQGLLLGTLATVVPFLLYRRSKQADAAAREAGTIGQIHTGLQLLVENLRELNVEQQQRLDTQDERFERQGERLTACIANCEQLLNRLNVMKRRYGVENGPTTVGGST